MIRRRNLSAESSVPEGRRFLRLVRKQEDSCAAKTRKQLPKLGEKAPLCFERLGTLLSLLDRTSSCYWGCAKGDHLIEYVTGRACSHTRAALRLMGFGFYDEALTLARSVGEAANLFFLFVNDQSELSRWKAVSDSERKKQFGPVKVRLALENRKLLVPVDEGRYGLLSERSVHVTPGTKPQAYNRLRRATGGGVYQEAGLLVALNEAAYALALLALSSAQLADLPRDPSLRVLTAARDLVEAIGNVDSATLPEAWGAARLS
jgi:hypothetical protein